MWDQGSYDDDNATISISYADEYDDYIAKTSGFEDYIPKTVNPGPWLLIVTTLLCLSTVYILPCMVLVGSRLRDKRRKKEEQCRREEGDDEDDHTMDEEDLTTSRTNTTNNTMKRASSVISASTGAKSVISGVESSIIAYSTVSNKSQYTFLSNGGRRRRRTRHRGGAHFHKENKERKLLKCVEFERTYEEQQLNCDLKQKELRSAAMRKKWSDVQSDLGPNYLSAPQSTPEMNVNNRAAKSELAGGAAAATTTATATAVPPAFSNNTKNASSTKQRYHHKRSPSPTQSYLSKIVDDISPNDAADASDPGITPPCTTYTVNSTVDGHVNDPTKEYSICCGPNALWRPSTLKHAFYSLVTLSEYDAEMSRLVKLTIPFAFGCIFEAGMEVVMAAIIGRLLGTDALTAYVVVDIFLGTTGEFIGGVIDSQVTLLSHAIGAGNNYLAGQYVQISTILYTLLQIPAIIFWRFAVYPLMLWLGFDDNIASYAQQYANVAVFRDLVEGWSEGIHSILEVTDHENFSATCDFIQGIINLGIAFAIIFIKGKEYTTLMDLAYMDLVMEFIFTIVTLVYCGFFKIWLKPFLPGMTKNFAMKNTPAVKNMISTALPLSIGSFLSYAEWELLTIFSSFMGPAEVTVWSIMGTIWGSFEAATEGIGDAAEVRVAYHLGKGNPAMARVASYKSVYIGVIISFLITSIFFMIGYDLASIFTSDETLIYMINQLLPYIGIGNISMTFGMVCWALIGGQGRYKLATFIQFITSWGITMPLAALFTYVFKFNLKGITASIIVGYMCTGSVMSYVILTCDWQSLSKTIMDVNAITGECDSSDDEEGSSSSSSSSSDSSSGSSNSSNNNKNLLSYKSVGTTSAVSSNSSSNLSSIIPGSNSSSSCRKMMNVGLLGTRRSSSSSNSRDDCLFTDEPTPIIKNVKNVSYSRI